MGSRVSNGSGFSLIEVLVALTIFSVGLLALSSLQLTGIQSNSLAQVVTAKMTLTDGVIEEVLALDGDDALLDRTDTADGNENWLWTIDPDDLDGNGSTASIEIAGAGICSVGVTVDADPTISGTTYTDLTRVVVNAWNTSNPAKIVSRTIMKRRY